MLTPQKPAANQPSKFTTFNPDALPEGDALSQGLVGIDAGHLSDGDTKSQYDTQFNPIGLDLNEYRAQQQGFFDKAANGVTKGVGNLVGVVGSAAGLLYGAGSAVVNQDAANVFHNGVTEKVSEFSEAFEDKFPLYKTAKEQNATAFSPDNWATSNFLFDGIVKNFGFSLGAGVLTKASVFGLNRLIAPYVLRGAAGLEELAVIAQTVGKGEKALSYLQKAATLKRVGDATTVLGGSLLAAGSEATIEANDAYKKALQAEELRFHTYLAEKGEDREALPHEKREWEETAKSTGLAVLAGNAAILGFSNFKQWGQGMNGSYREAIKRVAPNALEKWSNRASLLFNTSEAAEEGSQTALQSIAQSYYSRKANVAASSDLDDMVLSTLEGLQKLTSTKEGLESIFMGGVAGGLSHVAMGGAGEVWNGPENKYLQGQEVLANLRKVASENPLFASQKAAAVRHTSLQTDMDSAVASGDVYNYQNLRADSLKNMVQAHAEAGTMKDFLTQLDQFKRMDDESFAEAFGIEQDDFNRKTATQYVDKLKGEAQQLAKTWNNVTTNFAQRSSEDKEALYDTLTNIKNRDSREKELNQKILTATTLDYQALTILNPNLTDEEYVDIVTKELLDNPSDEVTPKEVQDFIRLKNERKELVQAYQNLLTSTTDNGESIPNNSDNKPSESTQEDNTNLQSEGVTEAEGVSEDESQEAKLARLNKENEERNAPAEVLGTRTQTDSSKSASLPISDLNTGQSSSIPSGSLQELQEQKKSVVAQIIAEQEKDAQADPQVVADLKQQRDTLNTAIKEAEKNPIPNAPIEAPKLTVEGLKSSIEQGLLLEEEVAVEEPPVVPIPIVQPIAGTISQSAKKFSAIELWTTYKNYKGAKPLTTEEADKRSKVERFLARLIQSPREASTLTYSVVHQYVGGTDRYNLFVEGPKGSIDLGFLQQTSDASKNNTSIQRDLAAASDPTSVMHAGLVLNNAIKEAAQKKS